ncbi:DEAD box ATP-dependent RNA helicase family member protein [Theileria equi strain WA]|uniref:ATP-dependent RNA helicase n=1 Tax=Theileria equi strain WA TaxID=1537102 RepID=L0AXA9_THEEQ|nr:DEAD box ATP-dependent RNA helicase family member protein [Theileria equi strain WA]AFZ80217.1 DEAD box ATP-dependent RNA helicase family member protein [Theileria equi strain WA]|eukprot:XP_004829883.1 DEAD box ATP-dependent RNA helicase family member protein [Theileria equi strain WA]
MDLDGPNENPLWVQRVNNYSDAESGKSSDDCFKEWDIHGHIRGVVKEQGITRLFPVQEKIIPLLLNNKYRDRYSPLSCDFIITAPTGNGISLIVIAPTRELVKQIYEICTWFTTDDPKTYNMYGGEVLRVICCYGNKSFTEDHKILMNKPPHIAIFTPGRFVEHFSYFDVSESKINVSTVKWIVMDEVDLLLSQTFHNWTGVVSNIFNEEKAVNYSLQSTLPQKILVSATIPIKSSEIDLLKLNRPLLFKADDAIYKIPKNLKQHYILSSKRSRPILIIKLLYKIYTEEYSGINNTLVFCSKRTTTHRIARMLQIYFNDKDINFRVLEFSASFSQKLRNEIIEKYRNENNICLICSDIASRGVDLSKTSVVVNYDFPKKLATYIHRIGRTARGTFGGESYVFVSKQDENKFGLFTTKLNMKDTIEQVEDNTLVDEELDAKIRGSYQNLAEMVEKCIGLENDGNIPFNTSIDDHMNLILN